MTVQSYLMLDRTCGSWERSVFLAPLTQGKSLHHWYWWALLTCSGSDPASMVIVGTCPRIMKSTSLSFPWDWSSSSSSSPWMRLHQSKWRHPSDPQILERHGSPHLRSSVKFPFDTGSQCLAITVHSVIWRSCRHECFCEGPKARVLGDVRMLVDVGLVADGAQTAWLDCLLCCSGLTTGMLGCSHALDWCWWLVDRYGHRYSHTPSVQQPAVSCRMMEGMAFPVISPTACMWLARLF